MTGEVDYSFTQQSRYPLLANLAKLLKRKCPETCLNGTAQSVDAQDNQYDTLLLSCSVTQTL